MRTSASVVSASLFFFFLSCEAAVNGSNDPPPDSQPPALPDDSVVEAVFKPYKPKCETSAALPNVSLHRLTNAEYRNTVNDLLGVTVEQSDFPSADEVGISGFTNDLARMNEGAHLERADIEAYFMLGRQVAQAALADNAGAVLGCTTNTDSCRRQIIARLGQRLYRRPLTTGTDSELERLLALMLKESTVTKGAELVLATMLSSVHFLYKSYGSYSAAQNGTVALSNVELATRLSYLVWASAPDTQLLQSDLKSPTVLRAELTRILNDPKADRLVTSFANEWFKYRGVKSVPIDAEFTVAEEVLDGALQETESFLKHVFRSSPRLLDLYDAEYSFLEPRLAGFYGISTSGAGVRKVDGLGAQRGGLLSQMSVLASSSVGDADTHPVIRGLWVVNEVLCTEVDPPPAGINTKPVIEEAKTPVDFARVHSNNNACIGCHALMDPIGLGLENYNAIGGWQTTYEHGPRWGGRNIAVDPKGSLEGQKFEGPQELKSLIAKNDKTQNCLAKKVLSYALGRTLTPRDYCVSEAIARDVIGDGQSFEQVIQRIVASDVFSKGSRP